MQWWQCEEWLWRWDWRCVTTGTLPEDLSLPLSMTLEAHTGGKGQKPFFFPFIQRKIKGEHARTAIKGERGHEKTTARFVCRRREGNLLCLVIFLYVVWKHLSGLYCDPVWTCRYAHCPSSRVDRGKNCKRIMTKTRAGYLHLPASGRLLPRGLFCSARPISWKPNFIQIDLKKKKSLIQMICSSEEPGRKKQKQTNKKTCKTLGRTWKSCFVLIRNRA